MTRIKRDVKDSNDEDLYMINKRNSTRAKC